MKLGTSGAVCSLTRPSDGAADLAGAAKRRFPPGKTRREEIVRSIMDERQTKQDGSVQAAAERFFEDLELRFGHDRPDCHSRACSESSTIPNGKVAQ